LKEVSAQYQKLLRELSATCFARDKLLADLRAVEKATTPIIAMETKAAGARNERPGGVGFGPVPGLARPSPPFLSFVEKRTASVTAQLAGTSKGNVPTMGFPFGGPGGPGRPGGGGDIFMRPFQPGDILPGPLQEMLKLTEAQKGQLRELQKDFEAK